MSDLAEPRAYKFASWNVNGLRAVMKKTPSFTEIAEELDADILGIQETKLQEGQIDLELPGYRQVWSYAERKGYSGTAVFTREEPVAVRHADELLAPTVLDAAGIARGSPLPRAACARWSFRDSGSSTCTRPTRKTSSRASTCAWCGTARTARF